MPVVINGTTGIETPGIDADPGIIVAQTLSVNSNAVSNVNGNWRNRIINGDMRIDQRNNGASVTLPGPIGTYTLDRWLVYCEQSSKLSVQRNSGSVTPPTGFTNYLGVASLSAYAITGNDTFSVQQVIEGFNVADLNWGTASASPATLSFWVRSSLTGTFGGSIATTKTAVWSMPFTFTIAAANTWTYVTVAITAPTATGGANTDNTQGVYIRFGLGSTGTAAGGTAGVWSANNYVQPTGTVSVVGTNGATFYITGVQLEAGSVATPFERRPYGVEFLLCQRYYYTESSAGKEWVFIGYTPNGDTRGRVPFPVNMRAAPSVSFNTTSWNCIGVGHAGTVVNYSVTGIASAAVNNTGWSINGNYGALPAVGDVVTWGSNTNVVVYASAEL